MTTLNPALGRSTSHRQAASLGQVASWYLHRMFAAMERSGRRRAAPELMRAARRLEATHPDIARDLLDQAQQWRDA